LLSLFFLFCFFFLLLFFFINNQFNIQILYIFENDLFCLFLSQQDTFTPDHTWFLVFGLGLGSWVLGVEVASGDMVVDDDSFHKIQQICSCSHKN